MQVSGLETMSQTDQGACHTRDNRECVAKRGKDQGKSESFLSIVSRAVVLKGKQICSESFPEVKEQGDMSCFPLRRTFLELVGKGSEHFKSAPHSFSSYFSKQLFLYPPPSKVHLT